MHNITIDKPIESCDSCIHNVEPSPAVRALYINGIAYCGYGVDAENATAIPKHGPCDFYEKGVIDVDFDVIK